MWTITNSTTGETERIKLLDDFVYSMDKEQIIGRWVHHKETWQNFKENEFYIHNLFSEKIVDGFYSNNTIVTTQGLVFKQISDRAIIDRYKNIDKYSALAAMFPPCSGELSGSGSAVTVTNFKGNQPVFVGLFSGGKGKFFFVQSNKNYDMSNYADVPNGNYEIYFVYANEMENLYKGDNFGLTNQKIRIELVLVEGGNFGIEKIDR
jgi:hypothetical protein